MDLVGLFAAAFLAATILPAQSELFLATLVLSDPGRMGLLVAVATAGNVLGSVVNWVLGRFLTRFQGRRWFPVRPAAMARAERAYRRWGRWSLLLSWVPVIGDPLTVVAGVLRERLAVFVMLVAAAKAGRYVAVAWLANGWSGG